MKKQVTEVEQKTYCSTSVTLGKRCCISFYVEFTCQNFDQVNTRLVLERDQKGDQANSLF